jgi:hypothetical protein
MDVLQISEIAKDEEKMSKKNEFQNIAKKLTTILYHFGDRSKYEDDKIMITSYGLANERVYIKINEEIKEEVYRRRYYGGGEHEPTYCDKLFHKGEWVDYIKFLYQKVKKEEEDQVKEDEKLRTRPCSNTANKVIRKWKRIYNAYF